MADTDSGSETTICDDEHSSGSNRGSGGSSPSSSSERSAVSDSDYAWVDVRKAAANVVYEDVVVLSSQRGGAERSNRAIVRRHSSEPAINDVFEGQEKGSYCGIATVAMFCKAAGRPLSQDDVYRLSRQEGIVSSSERMRSGLTLDMFSRLLAAAGFEVKTVYGSHRPGALAERFRRDARDAFRRPDGTAFIGINFWRFLHGRKGGHLSPVSAYDAETDSVLVNDPADWRLEPHWIDVDTLAVLMCRPDSGAKAHRGYAVAVVGAADSSS